MYEALWYLLVTVVVELELELLELEPLPNQIKGEALATDARATAMPTVTGMEENMAGCMSSREEEAEGKGVPKER